MNRRGEGTVYETKRGKHHARLPDARRTSLGLYDTDEEARTALILGRRADKKPAAGNSFEEFGRKVLDIRETDGVRGMRQERQRFRTHLEPSKLAAMNVAAIQAGDVAELARALKAKGCSHPLIKRCLSLASAVFTEAILQGKRPDNPCAGIKIRKPADAEDADSPWDYLRPDEMAKIHACALIPEWGLCLMRFAWGAGLRQGEQWNLRLEDLYLEGPKPYVMVRKGSKSKKPKSGKVRKVPLFGEALAAVRRWLELRSAWLAPAAARGPLQHPELVFPTVTGCRRPEGGPVRAERAAEMQARGAKKPAKVELIREWLALAGVSRRLRWHDLRHTCGTWLVNGWWGHRWTLEEVKDILGHSDISVTQRYAHLDESTLDEAARATGLSGNEAANALEELDPDTLKIVKVLTTLGLVGRAGIEPATYGLKDSKKLEEFHRALAKKLGILAADLPLKLSTSEAVPITGGED